MERLTYWNEEYGCWSYHGPSGEAAKRLAAYEETGLEPERIELLIPAADVAEVRHGRWILEREPDGTPYCFHCSVCDNDFHHIGIMTATDYCPNCGALMKEDEHEAD